MYQLALKIVRVAFRRLDYHYSGIENVPHTQGAILAINHVSNIDPVMVGLAGALNGFEFHFMAKEELFRVPILAQIIKSMGTVKVRRQAPNVADVLMDVNQALREGEKIAIYPEGTHTKDPDGWPMRFKTGAARMALETGLPLIPVAQWGAHRVMPRGSAIIHLWKRNRVDVMFMEPVDVSDVMSAGGAEDREAVEIVTRRLEQAVVAGVEQLRGKTAPLERFDPRRR